MQDLSWLDREAYPFEPKDFESGEGRMRYLDEGQGPPVLLVHGSSSWSFVYRDLIKTLSSTHRCIAPDHLGFGLSDKPPDAAYRPIDHGRRLRALIEHLELDDFTLVVHDFGGPIGLSYAVERPETVRSLVLFNTWMWSLRGEWIAEAAGFFAAGRFGTFLFENLNYELRVLFRLVWGRPLQLSRALHRQYLGPYPRPVDRRSILWLARELRDSAPWYDELWQRRGQIRDVPTLLLWGLRDPILRRRHLERWQGLFSNARAVPIPKAGHFVQEEGRDVVLDEVKSFLGSLESS